MNPSLKSSCFNTGAGPSGLLSSQFLLRQKYHVSLGEFVLSVSHDQRKKGDAPGVSSGALSNLSVASLSKTLTLQILIRDQLSQIFHHAMLPALLVAEQQPKELIRPRKKNTLSRILFLMIRVMVAALIIASRRYNENIFQVLSRGQRASTSTVALKLSSSARVVQTVALELSAVPVQVQNKNKTSAGTQERPLIMKFRNKLFQTILESSYDTTSRRGQHVQG
jgi:hypothetical protein